MNTDGTEHTTGDEGEDVSSREEKGYSPPRLTPLGNLRDVLAGQGSMPADGLAQAPGPDMG